MAFMKPEYHEDRPFYVETEDGCTYMVPSFVCESNNPEDFADYVDGDPVSVERSPKKVIVFRLSANGYMDCTNWEAADTIEQAKSFIEYQFGVNPDTGDELVEKEA